MEIWRARSFEKHLKAVLSSSSSSSSSSPRFSPSLHKTLLRRSFQTLASSPSPPPPPPLPHLSSSSSSSASSLSSLLFRRPLPRFSPPPRNLPLKPFSSVFSNQEIEWREEHHLSESCSGDESYQDHLIEVQQEKQSRFIPVKAYFLCTSIDLRSLQSQNAFNVIPPNSRATNYVVLRYYDVKGDRQDLESGFVNESSCHYMVVFQYGSIVLFNVSDHEADGYLKIVEKHASGLLPEMRKDDYAVVEKPNLETWMQGGLDYIVLKNLSIDGIRTIGSVLGQSIALDYYIRQVDGMVAEFTDINRGMEKTGTFTMKRKKLFQLVGKANSNLADVILKLGLFERTVDDQYMLSGQTLHGKMQIMLRYGNIFGMNMS
ncbi:uncharacterized protein LOC109724159 isoform X2 [Ananas comosus]|uniref:Uncharacterized protein LOC109724159 isoform X2 n=1 Tax=Ananas comosus TaxID=4615 RepID=A0A6P5GKG6_ANACO|nr:uncharacterized protein LOC109724159 isoform X2 [Ananas comosus]